MHRRYELPHHTMLNSCLVGFSLATAAPAISEAVLVLRLPLAPRAVRSGNGAEFLLRMLQRPACLVVGYDDSLPVGVVVVSSAN